MYQVRVRVTNGATIWQRGCGEMLNPRMKKNLPSSFYGNIGQFREILSNSKWVSVDYHVIIERCDDDPYKALLPSWGYCNEKK